MFLIYKGGGAKTVGKFHKKCAIKKDKEIKRLWWLIYGWFALILITGLLVALLLKTEFIRSPCRYCGSNSLIEKN